MESRGKVCVAHPQGRARLRPVCPSGRSAAAGAGVRWLALDSSGGGLLVF